MFFFYVWNGMLCTKYIIVLSPLAQALYLTRHHYRRTVPSGVDNNRIIEKREGMVIRFNDVWLLLKRYRELGRMNKSFIAAIMCLHFFEIYRKFLARRERRTLQILLSTIINVHAFCFITRHSPLIWLSLSATPAGTSWATPWVRGLVSVTSTQHV